jgi:hypothetical protein
VTDWVIGWKAVARTSLDEAASAILQSSEHVALDGRASLTRGALGWPHSCQAVLTEGRLLVFARPMRPFGLGLLWRWLRLFLPARKPYLLLDVPRASLAVPGRGIAKPSSLDLEVDNRRYRLRFIGLGTSSAFRRVLAAPPEGAPAADLAAWTWAAPQAPAFEE